MTVPLSFLTDDELQQRIDRFGRQMLEANDRYRRTRAIEDRTARDQCWITQRALLKERGRRVRIVRAMEERIGLA